MAVFALKNTDFRLLFFRAAAVLWGFSFIIFFRFQLETFYPFYRNYLPISQFALALFSMGYLALVTRRESYPRPMRNAALHILATGFVTAGAILLSRFFGQENAHLLFLLPLTGAALFIWCEISRQAFIYQTAKIFWLAGALIALIVARYITTTYEVFGLALLAVIISHGVRGARHKTVHERLVSLRLPVDLLRYVFLAEAFHASLGQNRANLIPVLAISGFGLAVPQILARIRTLRPHISQGIVILPLIFILLAALFNAIHYSLWGATAYALLAIWEGIYFNKAHEVYLKREKILVGIVLLSALIAYNIAIEWLQILSGVLILGVLAFMLYLIGRAKRKAIVVSFAAAVLLWAIALQWKYSASVTRDFWRPLRIETHRPQLPDPGLAMALFSLQKNSGGRGIYSNIFPDSLLAESAWAGQGVFARKSDPAILTAQLWYACGFNRRSRIYVFDEKSLGLYAEPQALLLLARLLEKYSSCDLYVTDGTTMRSVKKLGDSIRGQKPSPQSLTLEDAGKFLGLARAEKNADNLAAALDLYELIFAFYKNDPGILREMSALVAARGQLDKQIVLLTSLIALGKDSTIYDKKLLMELYALKRDKKKSAAIAYEILNADTESPLAIFTFLHRLFSDPFDRYEIEILFRRISLYQPKTDLEEIKYAGLKRQLEEQLKQDVTYERKYQDENHRQEFIYFPE